MKGFKNMLSSDKEAQLLASLINAANNGRVVAHPDVIVDQRLTSPEARRLREIQDEYIAAAKSANCIGGSG